MDTWFLWNISGKTLLQVHDWFFAFLLIAAAGSETQPFPEKKQPWRKKQFLIVHPRSSKPTNHLDRYERSAKQDLG
jgi:hypothetical protein